MKNIEFEWNTKEISRNEQEDFEKEIKERLTAYLSEAQKTEDIAKLDQLDSISVVMTDGEPPAKVKGVAYGIVQDAAIELIQRISVDSILAMEIGRRIFANSR